MNTHPNHTAVVEAIKAMPSYSDPQTFFESEVAECYSDEELVEAFGWDGEKALTPAQAVKEVKARNENREGVYGWIVEEGEAERRSAQEETARYLAELEEANKCGWLVERRSVLPAYVPLEDDPTLSVEENQLRQDDHSEGYYCMIEGIPDYEIVECGAKRSDIVRNGVRVGWECEAGHDFISEEYKTDEERYAEFLADREDS
jgi:hypothetical protein